MADPTAKDYYEQVTKEAHEKIVRDDERIATEVEEIVEAGMASLRHELGREFGEASVRCASLAFIEDVVWDIARRAAKRAQGVMIESHYQESQQSTGAMLEAVFAGMKLANHER